MRAGLKQFSTVAMGMGRAITKIGLAISAGYLAIAAGNEKVAAKAKLIHKTLSDAIAPAVMPLLDHALKTAQAFAVWAQQNQKILTNVLQIGVRLVAIGGALKLAAVAAKGLSSALLVAKIAVGAIGGMLATTWLGPLLIALATLVAIGALLYRYNQSWRAFFDQNTAASAEWASEVKKDINGIADALMSGRIELAWEIVLESMRMQWLKFKQSVSMGIADLAVELLQSGVNLMGPAKMLGMQQFVDAYKDTLKNMRIEDGANLEAMKTRMMAMREDAAGGRKGIGLAEAAKENLSAATAGGAIALTAGQGQSMAAKTYAELQNIKRGIYELVKKAQREQFRRDRPGLFGR